MTDLEGVELKVSRARSRLEPSSVFVIEVREEKFLPELKQTFLARAQTDPNQPAPFVASWP